MTEPSVGQTVLLENNGPVSLVYGVVKKVWDNDARNLVDVLTEDEDANELLVRKVPEKRAPTGPAADRTPTPSWVWFLPPASPVAEDA